MERRRRNSPDTALSKSLSWLLRHGAMQERLPISSDGFVDLELILSHKTFSGRNCRAEDIFRIVAADAKNRYTLRKCPQTGRFLVKANQGHSLSEVTELGLQKVSDPNQVPVVVHGTFMKNWERIKCEGLRRMSRNHIHFARTDDLSLLSSGRMSGFRKNCEVLVYVDPALAMSAGIEFFISENQVILSSGLNGVIAPQYFQKVLDMKSGKLLDYKKF